MPLGEYTNRGFKLPTTTSNSHFEGAIHPTAGSDQTAGWIHGLRITFSTRVTLGLMGKNLRIVDNRLHP